MKELEIISEKNTEKMKILRLILLYTGEISRFAERALENDI